MLPSLINVAAAIGAVLAVRTLIVRRVERADAARPREPTGVRCGADGFTLDHPGAPAVLLLHGAGDTPQTLRALGAVLHARGFAVSAPLLPGHGRRVRDFRTVSASRWRAAALEAYDQMAAGRPWTAVVGLSMGGALAVLTAAERPEVGAVVLLAPYLELPTRLQVAAVLSPLIGLAVPYLSSEDARSIRDPDAAAQSLAYGVFTPAAIRALRATAAAGSGALGRVHAPTLIVQSRQDNRVSLDVAVHALHRLGAVDKRLEWVSEGGHVITVDYGKGHVFDLTRDWLLAHGAAALLPP